MYDKVKQILDLISEKSRALQDELSDMPPISLNEDYKIELRSQIAILDETYSEALLISKQDD
jgi:hypothetical protein